MRESSRPGNGIDRQRLAGERHVVENRRSAFACIDNRGNLLKKFHGVSDGSLVRVPCEVVRKIVSIPRSKREILCLRCVCGRLSAKRHLRGDISIYYFFFSSDNFYWAVHFITLSSCRNTVLARTDERNILNLLTLEEKMKELHQGSILVV